MRQNTALLSAAIVVALASVATSTSMSTGTASDPSATPASAASSNRNAVAVASRGPSHHQAAPGRFADPQLIHDVLPARTVSGEAAEYSPEARRAQSLLASGAAKGAHRAEADRFAARDVIVDDDGTEHVRMDRTYQGLPVVGGDIVLHSRDGQVVDVSGGLTTDARPSLQASVSADSAMVIAGADFHGKINDVSSKGLVVYARGEQPVLAHEIRVRGISAEQGDADMRYFVDAHNGKVLDNWNIIQTAAANGTGKSLFVGNVALNTDSTATGYRLVDTTRGNGNTRNGGGKVIDSVYNTAAIMTDTDNIWGTNTESSVQSSASDAHFGVAKTWDFYKNTFGRSGIYNDGVGVKSIVNVLFYLPDGVTTTGNNAGWYGSPYKFMAYGKGSSTWYPVVALDVAGHEMSHGVTEATAGLVYSGESGGLNEATSDILGSMVEFYAGNASDTGDYLIGEKVMRSGGALRSMYSPNSDGASADCWYSGVGSINVHYSSGVGNHFYYLLAEGTGAKVYSGVTHSSKTCLSTDTKKANGTGTLTGIGRTAAQAIWYRALSVYMTSTSNYASARTATLNAAAYLYGTGSTNYNAVAAAWSAVRVN